jgi:hypothetical protein
MDAKAMILERYHAQLADGTQRFAPPTKNAFRESSSVPQNSTGAFPFERCASCTCQNEGEAGALRTQQWPWIAAEVFALADYPTAEAAPSNILARLLDKLPGASEAHRAFALKCSSRRGDLTNAICEGSRALLARELAAVAPRCILCFGGRALEGLREAAKSLAAPLAESSAPTEKTLWESPWGPVNVLVLPSALELERFPLWRQGVWERLSFLRDE